MTWLYHCPNWFLISVCVHLNLFQQLWCSKAKITVLYDSQYKYYLVDIIINIIIYYVQKFYHLTLGAWQHMVRTKLTVICGDTKQKRGGIVGMVGVNTEINYRITEYEISKVRSNNTYESLLCHLIFKSFARHRGCSISQGAKLLFSVTDGNLQSWT